jgi:glutathionylspermidine amidase/synthetase
VHLDEGRRAEELRSAFRVGAVVSVADRARRHVVEAAEERDVQVGDVELRASVWKTWAWETALDQIRLECDDDEEKLRNYQPGQKRDGPPRLVDVLLRKDVMVYEPLWTLIPSNKAILPVLWQLFPNHQYLLNSAFELSEELRGHGYVVKPIVGRRGSNISIFDANEELIEATTGEFENRSQMYQELFRLPHIDSRHVQVSTFTASGYYAGSGARLAVNMVVDGDSDLLALRVVDDEEILEA